jgi:DnaJ homolog subfamily A member 2
MFFSNIGSGNSNDTSLYDELGVQKSATSAEIKRAYKKMALKYHPDRNKEPEAEERFKKISSAYEILMDEEKRSNYDKFGLDAVKNGANMPPGFGGAGNPFDIFDNIFNNGSTNMRNKTSRKQRQGRSIVKEIEVPLTDIYNENKLTLGLNRSVKCETCVGSGCKPGKSVKTCSKCDGSGMFVKIQQFGPGMISQTTQTCGDCRGQGKQIDPNDKCEKCNGSKIENKKSKLHLPLKKTYTNGEKVVFNEMADYDPEVINQGDLIIMLKVKNNTEFQRIENDLIYTKSITLLEALCGLNLIIKHIDDRELFIKTSEVIQPESIYKVLGEGMTPFNNLYIKFTVVLPNALSDERKKYIKKLIQNQDQNQDQNAQDDETTSQDKEIKFMDQISDTEYEIVNEKINENKIRNSQKRSNTTNSNYHQNMDNDNGDVPSCATQ